MILEIACPLPLHKTFDYLPPSDLNGCDPSTLIGRRVKVPFGSREILGLVTASKKTSEAPIEKIKAVSQIVDETPLLDERSIELGRWLSRHTACSLGEALFSLLPPGKEREKPVSSSSSLPDPKIVSVEEAAFALTPGQKQAEELLRNAVHARLPKAFLIVGVAVSGKTEVYMAGIKEVLSQGKTALYVVPEIGLVAQTASILKKRFGERSISVWHSHISLSKRRSLWHVIQRGEAPLVVGTRSAVLLPLRNMGIIIVDEEHDTAYKEEQKPRYHTRDVALKRGNAEGAVVVLGSATPSLEALQAAHEERLSLVELEERVSLAARPRTHLVDMKSEKAKGILSPSLLKAIEERLKNHEQSILFLNRRGFHRFSLCPHCGWVARCERCHIALVYHKGQKEFRTQNPEFPPRPLDGPISNPELKREPKPKKVSGLICHYCSSSYESPKNCPNCGQQKLFSGGYGTQRVVEELQEKFPWAHIVRWDRDAARERGDHEKIYQALKEEKFDILVGTQIVAQGFHWPKVTLVGVLDAEAALHIPDYRAAEKTFQLLTQVAGRAGREMITGDVFIQSRNADHYAMKYALEMDYKGFAQTELGFRKDLNYPPFGHLIQVLSLSKKEKRALEDMNDLSAWASQLNGELSVAVLGPTKAKRAKRHIKAHYQLLLKVPNEIFDEFLKRLEGFLSSAWSRYWMDVDPL